MTKGHLHTREYLLTQLAQLSWAKERNERREEWEKDEQGYIEKRTKESPLSRTRSVIGRITQVVFRLISRIKPKERSMRRSVAFILQRVGLLFSESRLFSLGGVLRQRTIYFWSWFSSLLGAQNGERTRVQCSSKIQRTIRAEVKQNWLAALFLNLLAIQ